MVIPQTRWTREIRLSARLRPWAWLMLIAEETSGRGLVAARGWYWDRDGFTTLVDYERSDVENSLVGWFAIKSGMGRITY